MRVVAWCKEYWIRGWMKLAGRGPVRTICDASGDLVCSAIFQAQAAGRLNP